LRGNDYFRSLDDQNLQATVTFPGPPYRLAKTPAGVRMPAATIGEHNHAIYVGELGMNEDQLDALKSAGVV
jgi:formyl-CoA transferase